MKSTIKLAYNHLSNDKVMSYLIDKFRNKIDWGNRYNSNYAFSIANLIIEQHMIIYTDVGYIPDITAYTIIARYI